MPTDAAEWELDGRGEACDEPEPDADEGEA